MADNLDLQIRRMRVGKNQADIARLLRTSRSAVSDFETGARTNIRKGVGRAEYEALLARLEAGEDVEPGQPAPSPVGATRA